MSKETLQEKLDMSRTWIFILAACLILFLIFILIMAVYPESSYKYRELKQQLSECQMKVPGPVCDFEDGYWGFKVVCSDDFFGWRNKDRVIDQHFHQNLESCEEGLKFYISYKHCEVIE